MNVLKRNNSVMNETKRFPMKKTDRNEVYYEMNQLNLMGIRADEFGTRKGCVDLHIHSNISDGAFSVKDICSAASFLGLSAISITDHLSVKAYQDFHFLEAQECIILPGMEVITFYNDKPYHILLYGSSLLSEPFTTYISCWQEKWNLRFDDICQALYTKYGIDVDYSQLLMQSGKETLDISDVSHAIAKKTNENAEFIMQKYFNQKVAGNNSIYLHSLSDRYLPSMVTVLQVAKAFNLHCVLAHPTQNQIADIHFSTLRSYGLTGIEVYHPTINRNFRESLILLAKENGLKVFGGSDFHDPNKHFIQFGFRDINDHNVRIPFAIYANSILDEPHIIVDGQLSINKLTLEEKISLLLRPSFELMAFDAESINIIKRFSITNCRIEKTIVNSSEAMMEYMQSCINANTHPILINVNQEGGRLNTVDWFEHTFLSNSSVSKLSKAKRKYHNLLLFQELKLLGISWNLAPVCDLRSPNSPSIGNRSYGNNLNHVCECIFDFLDSSKKCNIATCLKHFPGIGNSNQDSHICTPALNKIESTHIAPFLYGMIHGSDSIMIGNIVISQLDDLPALVSPKTITDLLKIGLGAEQIIVTDNLSMHSLIDDSGDISLVAIAALLAGADFVMLNPDFSRGKPTIQEKMTTVISESKIRSHVLHSIAQYVREGKIPETRIDMSVEKVISFYNKYAISALDTDWRLKLSVIQERKDAFMKAAAEELVHIVCDHSNILPLMQSYKMCTVVFMPTSGAKADSTWHRNVFVPEDMQKDTFYINENIRDIYEILPRKDFDVIIYVSYNILTYPSQKDHIRSIDGKYVVISTGDDDEALQMLNVPCCISACERNMHFLRKAYSLLGTR